MLAEECAGVALGGGDSHELGFSGRALQIIKTRQSRESPIGMAVGAIDVANGEIYFRSNHGFKSLPTAARALNGGGRTVYLRTAGLYTYPLRPLATVPKSGTSVI
jgi:hypothetical protein